jgi:hypothetical protein
MTTNSLFWFVVYAGLGGLFVFVGLLMEKFWEKKWHSNISDFRRSKTIREIGEWIVIGGIVAEIIVAVSFAKVDWENDPLNRPIRDMAAVVSIKVKGGNYKELDTKSMTGGKMSWVALLKMFGANDQPLNVGVDTLFSDNFSTLYVQHSLNSDRVYSLRFAAEMIGSNPKEKPAKEINKIDKIGMEAFFLPPSVEILGGDVELIVNSDIRKTFKIIPQKNRNKNETFGKYFFLIIATNDSPENLW